MSDQFLYHYCSTDTFFRIVESRELWLTNMFHMNDSAEHRWLRSIAADVLKQMKPRSREIYHSLEASLWEEKDPEIYCACFSEDGDSLGQWRGYADDGRGVAIGFSRYFLQEAAKANRPSLSLEWVAYCPAEQERRVKAMFKTKKSKIPLQARSLPKEYIDDLDAVVAKAELWLEAARCKNPFFREEREVRLIYRPSIGGGTLGECRFHSRGRFRIPHYTLPIPVAHPGIAALCRIVFGPKSSHRLYESLARSLFLKNGYALKSVQFATSNGTYR